MAGYRRSVGVPRHRANGPTGRPTDRSTDSHGRGALIDAEPDGEPVLAKANFDEIYDAADPRTYFRALGAYDYAAPHYGQQVFRRVLDVLPVEQPTVVDLCCSYGVNAALLKHDIELSDLYQRYRSDEVRDLSTEELAERDRAFYASVRRDAAPEVIGLDAAGNAVAYAVDVGLLDQGVVADLEAGGNGIRPRVGGGAARAERPADLVTVTGGIGYITERTFDRVLSWFDPERPPWVASLCLRTVPFEPIAERLAARGLVTEQLDGVTFPQRRFASEDERRYALSALDALGIETTGREAEGCYHANVFLSRPPADVAARPIDTILDDLPEEATHRPTA